MVLLVIDTQKALMNHKLFAYEKFVENMEQLIYKAREKNIEVIYVVHDDGIGSELSEGNTGFEIYQRFEPTGNEKTFVKKVNSAFYHTGLLEYLIKKEEKNIVVTGLQTDKCINATVISGFEHGFHIIVPAYTNSTVDNVYMDGKKSYLYYNEFMWKSRFAECLTVAETIARMN